MKKHIFPYFIALFFILFITGCGAQDSQEAVPEDAEIALETTTVDGQEYYLLTSAEDLCAIGKACPLSGNYILANDITMSGEWNPIGSSKDPFTGIFDGFFPMVHHPLRTEIKGCSINAGTQVREE